MAKMSQIMETWVALIPIVVVSLQTPLIEILTTRVENKDLVPVKDLQLQVIIHHQTSTNNSSSRYIKAATICC